MAKSGERCEAEIAGEILDWCAESGCTEFWQLAQYARERGAAWLCVLLDRAEFFSEFVRSYRYVNGDEK